MKTEPKEYTTTKLAGWLRDIEEVMPEHPYLAEHYPQVPTLAADRLEELEREKAFLKENQKALEDSFYQKEKRIRDLEEKVRQLQQQVDDLNEAAADDLFGEDQ